MAYNEQQNMKRNGANPAVAGMVGAAIGAAVGSAATAILSDQQKRTKVVKAIKGFQQKALSAADNFKNRAGDLPKTASEAVDEAQKKLEEGGNKKARRQTL